MQIIPHSSSIFVSTNQYELLLDELKARLPGLEDSIQCIAQETAERKRERDAFITQYYTYIKNMIKGTMKVEEEKKSTAILAVQEPPSTRSVSD